MKFWGIFVSVIPIMFLAACMDGMTGTESSQLGRSVAQSGLDGGFRSNEQLVEYRLPGEQIRQQRKGTLSDIGFNYGYTSERFDIELTPINSRAAGTVGPDWANWLGGCRQDNVTDQTTCRINIIPTGPLRSAGGLTQTVDRSGNITRACIIGHDFPGRYGQIRVDGHAAIRTDTDGCISGSAARQYANQLASGNQVITRRVEWPYDSNRDRTIVVSNGYSTARDLFRFSASANLPDLFSTSR